MGAKSFLIINGLIVLVLIVRLLTLKKRARPTPLNLGPLRPPSTPPRPRPEPGPGPVETGPGEGPWRSLTCAFEHGGRVWDAFEVLGLPAGSRRDECRRAMVDLRRNGSFPEDFLNALWSALEKHFPS